MNNENDGGNHKGGYGRPPKSGQIKQGEVRNPWGRNGKPRVTEDLLLKVASETVTTNVNGRTVTMTLEEAAYRRLILDAQKSPTAMKVFMEHITRRRPPLPPMSTPEELAQQEAEQQEKKALAARLVGLLEAEAARKKGPRVRFGPGFKPIREAGSVEESSGTLDQSIDKPRG